MRTLEQMLANEKPEVVVAAQLAAELILTSIRTQLPDSSIDGSDAPSLSRTGARSVITGERSTRKSGSTGSVASE